MAYTEEEMAQYQRLSNEYVPDVQGPLISPRISCQRITEEFAQADATYIQKTTSLAQKFSEYRTVKGDGNYGWRALAYGYFEAILASADPPLAASAELTRLNSLDNLLMQIGYQRDIFDDFVDESKGLLKKIASMAPDPGDNAVLLADFNNPEVCNAIIMHFRLVTAAWMKTHANDFLPFTEGMPIDQYCAANIEPYAVELEHIGLQACFNAILKPAGIALQVLYLDRSAGDEVNELDWAAAPSNLVAPDGGVPTVRLLYRPGHYDILYKLEDIVGPPPPSTTTAQINFMSDPAYFSTSNLCYTNQSGLDLNTFWLPGLISAGISSMPFSTHAFPSTSTYTPSTSISTYTPSSVSISPTVSDSYNMPYSSPPHNPVPVSQSQLMEGFSSGNGFRPSRWQFAFKKDPQVIPAQVEPCQTEAMKQAGESPAHFKNKSFQPQIWEPGSEYKNSETSRRRSS